MRSARCCGCPVAACGVPGRCCFLLCVWRCSAVCAVFVPRWRCCFAAWLRSPGEAAGVECVGSRCPLSPFCAGRASLVPGSSVSSASRAFWAPPAVLLRREVARSWLRRAGWPGAPLALCSFFALPFPSVLSAASRAGVLPSLWGACLSARRRYSAWLGAGCPR